MGKGEGLKYFAKKRPEKEDLRAVGVTILYFYRLGTY